MSNPSTRKVWVVRPLEKVDMDEVAKFGMVMYVFDRSMVPLHTNAQQNIIRRHTLKMASPDDLILISGPAVMLTVLTFEWSRHFGLMNQLLYRRQGEYYEQEIR